MDGNTDLRQRRTAPKEVRRKQLIDATISVIADKGVSGATMAAVTGTAGLSLGIVSLHFESKDNLLKATLLHLSDELQEAWASIATDLSRPAALRLWAIIDAAFLPHICTKDKVRTWFAFFGEARYRAFYREMVRDYDDQRSDAISALIEELAEGRGDIDPEALSDTIEMTSDGLWLSMMIYPEWTTRKSARERLWALLSVYFPTHFPPGEMPEAAQA